MRTSLLTSLTFISLALVSGCGDQSKTNKEPNVNLPKADFTFSQANKEAIISERQPITQGLQVTFKDQLFDHLLFSHQEAPVTYFKLASQNNERITLMLYTGDQSGNCGIYQAGTIF